MAEDQTTPDAQAQADAQAKADADAKAKADADKGGSGDEKVTLTKEEYEDLKKAKENDTNKSKALEEERAKRKSYEDKIKATEEAERKAKEEAMKKEGKTEELLKQKDEELNSIKPEYEKYKSFYEEKQQEIVAENDKMMKEIPETEKAFVKEAIDGKDVQAQNRLLKGFSEKFKSNDFWKKPWEGDNPGTKDRKAAEFEKAKEGGFRSAASSVVGEIFGKRS